MIAGKCRDFIYTDDETSSVSTHSTGANLDPFELKNKIEGTKSECSFFVKVNSDELVADVAWYM